MRITQIALFAIIVWLHFPGVSHAEIRNVLLLPPHTPSASSVAATAVFVLRHGAFPIALGNEMWQKCKIGEAFKIVDRETKEDGIWAGPPPPGKAAATPDR